MTNLLLHAFNAFLVFLLARGLLRSPEGALAAAVVYAMHPLQTEAVVSIVGRSELLAAGLFFAAWLAFRNGRMWLSATAYFLSMLAKESAITLPAIAMLDVALGESLHPLSGSMSVARNVVRKLVRVWKRLAMLAATAIAYLA